MKRFFSLVIIAVICQSSIKSYAKTSAVLSLSNLHGNYAGTIDADEGRTTSTGKATASFRRTDGRITMALESDSGGIRSVQILSFQEIESARYNVFIPAEDGMTNVGQMKCEANSCYSRFEIIKYEYREISNLRIIKSGNALFVSYSVQRGQITANQLFSLQSR